MKKRAALLLGFGLLLAVLAGELAVRLAAVFSFEVRYLATAGRRKGPRVFKSLDEYLASSTHLLPHRNYMNYWANALGLYDEEFVIPKPPDRFRIMALGDSFTYGSVPYPDSVMTRLEAHLHAACPELALDLLNFGIPATGVWDYQTVFQLAHATYTPNLVLVNFYLGNDGPDAYRHTNDLPKRSQVWHYSFLWVYLHNGLRLWTGFAAARRILPQRHAESASRPNAAAPQGGAIVDPQDTLPADAPQLVGPVSTAPMFQAILAAELGQLYRPEEPRALERDWRPILAVLDELHTQVRAARQQLILTLYPSQAQVYPQLWQEALGQLQQQPRYAQLTADRIDPALPNRVLLAYCAQHGIVCIDLTAALVHASQTSPEPLYKLRDTHWTVRGNRVAAEVQASQLAPLVCPSAFR
jgi:hypothetical protein